MSNLPVATATTDQRPPRPDHGPRPHLVARVEIEHLEGGDLGLVVMDRAVEAMGEIGGSARGGHLVGLRGGSFSTSRASARWAS